jgi:uncharacterized membrane protein YhdT
MSCREFEWHICSTLLIYHKRTRASYSCLSIHVCVYVSAYLPPQSQMFLINCWFQFSCIRRPFHWRSCYNYHVWFPLSSLSNL